MQHNHNNNEPLRGLSDDPDGEFDGGPVSAQSLLYCLEYLCQEAQGAGFDLTAHLIGAAAEAVRAESHLPQGEISHGDVLSMPIAPQTKTNA
ncbi:hypothetical protein [Varunaivibrio sulfuroxidans]|uniref:Uncharacterized protein n=1 Tax=Varunaivibrio sulfuroxidans TaxID=1773489 RepID=A0A4R3JBM2_9PROT|nr:hypothetical protein [Varunaivibrio sulfuroxidans]TCS62486.1 hypothetical protein EDD55_10531 [Varunaivibrio sulfuroxidans]WES30842.1 hypothetical protein P3M64_00240 [Varunaivibrio sulfuroxidans]